MDRVCQIEEWFYKYGDDVYNYLIYYTGSLDVEDLVQEVFLKALKSLSSFEERANPKTWLLSIARNLVIDISRRKKLLSFLSLSVVSNKQLQIDTSNPITTIVSNEVLLEIHSTILSLRKSYMDVLVSRLILELSVEETASILSWSTSKVSLTYHRAIKALQKSLKQNYERNEADYEGILPK
ncbi:RNA polymerase sigma factor [Ferdinandcohnia sp. Marseille-Q9671]